MSVKTTTHHFHAHASLIPLLHAARYPHCAVIGCLLGPRGLAVEQQGTKGESQTIHYTHAVPLLHHWTGLSAALEMGLELVEEYAESKDLEILGFYFAHEGLNEAAQGPPIPIRRLQEQIEARRVNSTGDAKGKGKDVAVTGSRVVPNTFELDNANLTSDSKAFRLLPCTTLPSSSSTITFSTESSPPPPASLKVNPQQAVIAPKAPKSKPASPSRVPGLIKANEHLKLCDFDAHLEDMGARWLENELVEL